MPDLPLAAQHITMMEFRAGPGEFIHQVAKHRRHFIITRNGKPMAQLAPVARVVSVDADVTTITEMGEIVGELPLTLRRRL